MRGGIARVAIPLHGTAGRQHECPGRGRRRWCRLCDMWGSGGHREARQRLGVGPRRALLIDVSVDMLRTGSYRALPHAAGLIGREGSERHRRTAFVAMASLTASMRFSKACQTEAARASSFDSGAHTSTRPVMSFPARPSRDRPAWGQSVVSTRSSFHPHSGHVAIR